LRSVVVARTAARMTPATLWAASPASELGARVDVLFYCLVALTGTVALALATTVIAFCIRYRRSAQVRRDATPIAHPRALEIAWITVPLAIFLVIFAAATWLYPQFYAAPPDAVTVYVIGKQWMWKLEHADGSRELDELHVPLGRSVRLVMISQDVIHSFFVPAMRFKQDLLPGRFTTVTFKPTRAGTFGLGCAEFCGERHAYMRGSVVVLPPAAFEQWLRAAGTLTPLAERGFRLYRELGCSGCHEPGSTVHAPDLHGIFGRTLPLADGRRVLVDENYLRDSMLLPSRDIAAGHPDLMPSFAGVLHESDIVALIAWIRSTR
jgi:cytochrome c oxidase subunit 2